ncbi:MAG: chalcone isomerase family protein [Gammaproteobacteria bacterium]
MKQLSRAVLANTVMLVLLCTLSLQPVNAADPTENLDPVGSATLKVLFWTIYDSYLYSPDGQYDGIEPNLVLQIDYRRDISRENLINRTREEWQKLGLYDSDSEGWLNTLSGIFPNLEKGDQLLLRVNQSLGSEFYFNERPIGGIDDPTFTEDFLSIWLSEDSSYPKQRDRLVGQRS